MARGPLRSGLRQPAGCGGGDRRRTAVTASADENSDLFWGLRGAGANLGIVTRFDYRLHPIGQVLGGMVVYPMSNGRAALRLFDDFADYAPMR